MMFIRKQGLVLFLLAILALVVSPQSALASAYGECGYGEGTYNEGCATSAPGGSGSGSSGSSTPSAPVCTDTAPTTAPWLYEAIAQNGTSILLYFTEANDPVDHYALEFGTEAGNYQFAAEHIGGKGSRTYLVESLQPNTSYYFRVRAGNGCATGEWSNELSAKTKSLVSFNQLEIVDSELTPVPPLQQAPADACQAYTVQPGDSLWSIAQSELGDGNRYSEIAEDNQDTYPSLTTGSLEAGWQLSLCPVSEIQETEEPGEEAALQSYIVNVNVFDSDQNPVGGATVEIHSEVQEMVTDEHGTVRFEDVEPGQHRVLVAYDGHEGEQSIFLTGDTKEFTLNITLEMKSVLASPKVLAIVGVMGVVIAVLIGLLLRARARQ